MLSMTKPTAGAMRIDIRFSPRKSKAISHSFQDAEGEEYPQGRLVDGVEHFEGELGVLSRYSFWKMSARSRK